MSQFDANGLRQRASKKIFDKKSIDEKFIKVYLKFRKISNIFCEKVIYKTLVLKIFEKTIKRVKLARRIIEFLHQSSYKIVLATQI